MTFTGASDYTSVRSLCAISEKFPFIEWGILYCPYKTGIHTRYPSLKWIKHLIESKTEKMRLSLHLCGKGRKEFLDSVETKNPISFKFDRVQLNLGGNINKFLGVSYTESLREFAKSTPVILGGYLSQSDKVDFPEELHLMYDRSGGKGKEINCYDEPIYNNRPIGYCGGLTPENILYKYNLIKKAAKDAPIWMDSESGIMHGTTLSLIKCLKIARLLEGTF